MKKTILSYVLIAVVLGTPLPAFSQEISAVVVKKSGSVPEVPGLYACIWRLKGESYVEQTVDRCVQSISKTKYFTNVKAKAHSSGDNKVALTFVLDAPKLTVREIQFRSDPGDLPALKAWVAEDPDTLHEGQSYDRSKETETKNQISAYFQSQGRIVGVTSAVRLDYAGRSSRVEFDIAEGPRGPSNPVLPAPHDRKCPDVVAAMDWSDLNQYTPIPLLERMIILNAVGTCFSNETLMTDQSTLQQSGLFDSATLTASSDSHRPQITLRASSKPLTIGQVRLRFFPPGDKGDEQVPQLPLKVGATYLRANAETTKHLLQKAFRAPGKKADIFENDSLEPDHTLTVVFDVLRYPEDELFINGRQIAPVADPEEPIKASGSNCGSSDPSESAF